MHTKLKPLDRTHQLINARKYLEANGEPNPTFERIDAFAAVQAAAKEAEFTTKVNVVPDQKDDGIVNRPAVRERRKSAPLPGELDYMGGAAIPAPVGAPEVVVSENANKGCCAAIQRICSSLVPLAWSR